MKLVSYGPLKQERLGILLEDKKQIIDLQYCDSSFPCDIITFLRKNLLSKAKSILQDLSQIPTKAIVDLNNVRLGAPVPRPRLIVCIGQNYRGHADEQNVEYPKAPILFNKSPGAVCGPNDNIIYPANVEKLDYEVELALIIGKEGKQIEAKNAFDYIAGYSVFHDVSARCVQFGDKQWFRGKSFDTFAPFGPALVTQDEITNPHNLNLFSKVNGEIRQNSNTTNLIFNIPFLLEYITASISLEPGDIVATGTPEGVGVFSNPPKLLKRGDVVEMEIESLGTLKNHIV